MAQQYNQLRAMLAITKASFKAIFRSPSSVAFSFGFPLIFILVFGFIGGGGPSVRIALAHEEDMASPVIRHLLESPLVKLTEEKNETAARKDLEKGKLAAILSLDSVRIDSSRMQYKVRIQTASSAADKYPIVKMALGQMIQTEDDRQIPPQLRPVVVEELPMLPGRAYSMIDFILPGMLGFSLLAAAVFGVAFVFFNLRQQLVLKRFFATPIHKRYIVMGEGLARVLFQLITAVVIIAIGKLFFHFTLIHGWLTFLEMIVLSLFGLVVFMGLGFIVSSVARNESVIPFFANMLTLPQLLLSGTFFSTDAFPDWLQKICELLPLKQLNDAMRDVAFEGAHLTDCGKPLGVLVVWGVLVYAVAIKLFKWE